MVPDMVKDGKLNGYCLPAFRLFSFIPSVSVKAPALLDFLYSWVLWSVQLFLDMMESLKYPSNSEYLQTVNK